MFHALIYNSLGCNTLIEIEKITCVISTTLFHMKYENGE